MRKPETILTACLTSIMTEPIAAFWCRIPSRANFGDALTPWMIHRISGHYPMFLPPDNPRTKFFVTGSIIGLTTASCTVWGAGIMDAHDRIANEATLLAVRGPLTRTSAIAQGVSCPDIFGDPALLLPRLYSPPVNPPSGVGLALHFSDRPRLLDSPHLPSWVRLIDMQQSIESVIDQIRECELVISSSLHGIIVSHAYGIPAVWVEFKPLPSGDGSKFRDYLQSIDCYREQPLRLSVGDLTPQLVEAHRIDPPHDIDLESLWYACPFRKG